MECQRQGETSKLNSLEKPDWRERPNRNQCETAIIILWWTGGYICTNTSYIYNVHIYIHMCTTHCEGIRDGKEICCYGSLVFISERFTFGLQPKAVSWMMMILPQHQLDPRLSYVSRQVIDHGPSFYSCTVSRPCETWAPLEEEEDWTKDWESTRMLFWMDTDRTLCIPMWMEQIFSILVRIEQTWLK